MPAEGKYCLISLALLWQLKTLIQFRIRVSIYNTINISHSGDLAANVSRDSKSLECNRFFVTYIILKGEN